VQIVAGVAQAIALLAGLLREDGIGSVAVEDPGSLGARQQLEAWNVRTRPVRVDDEGVDVGLLTASGERVVMATPAHQFPTGVVLSGPRRRDLSAWAQAGGLIVEDDYDAEHRYDRPPVAALRATLADHVYYAGSVSKTLAPALRLGWVLAPPRWRERLAALKRDTDLGSATLPQLVLAHLMARGDLERHLRRARRRHRQRRDATVAALARHLPGVRIQGAAAGLHLTVLLPEGVVDTAVAADGLAAGVKVHPLTWHRIEDGPPGLVLGYAASSAADIERGIETLARVLPGPTRPRLAI
jgi:GntR family transcriptional regulator/MocR family aminotransferase